MKIITLTLFVFVFLCTSAYADINQGLIGHWKLDETSGTTTSDSSGNGRNGTIEGSPERILGRRNNAILFDGKDDWVNLQDIDAVEFGPDDEFSISLWVLPTVDKTEYIIGKYPTYYWHVIPAYPQRWTWNLYTWPGTGDFTFTIADNVTEDVDGTPDYQTIKFYSPNPGEWYHIVITAGTQNDYIRFFVNGTEIESKATQRLIGQLTQNTNLVRIGGIFVDPFDGLVEGGIDDARIYNRILDQTDIQSLTQANVHRITVVAGDGGNIEPKGNLLSSFLSIPQNSSQEFTITADDKYEIKDVLIDGVSQGALSTHTFSNVTEDHVIKAEFKPKTGSGIPEGVRPVATYNRDNFKPFDEKYNFFSLQAMVKAIRAEGHSISTGHPRIFINNSNKETLRQKIISNPGLMAIMQEAVNFAHQYYKITISDNIPSYNSETKTQPAILADGLIYQLDAIPGIDYLTDPDTGAALTPLDYGKDGVRHLMSTLDLTSGWTPVPTPGGYYGHIPYYGPPLGYDWLYDLMTAEQKNTIGNLILEMSKPTDTRISNSPPGPKLLGAIAVHGDGINDDEAKRLINLFYKGFVFGDNNNVLLNHGFTTSYNFTAYNIFIPEGPGKQGFAYTWKYDPIYHFFEVWYDQTGEDYFKLPFMQNWVYQALHSAGNGFEFSAWNRYSSITSYRNPGGFPYSHLMLMSAIGLARTNPTAAELADKYKRWTWTYGLTEKIVYLLRGDTGISPKTPFEAGLHETAHFRGINRVFSRNSWQGSDATWMWFQGPTWTCIRNGGPVNELMIWKNGGMLLGKHGGQNHDYYGLNRTSTLVLYDEDQPEKTLILKNVMDGAHHYGLGIRLNSGGSLSQLNKTISGYHKGLRYFEENPGKYLYMLGDGTDGFAGGATPSKLDNWSRQLIWFKSPGGVTDHFIMLDRLRTQAETISAQVPLNFAQNPSIKSRSDNQDLGQGNVEAVTNRFIKTSIGGIFYYSVVDYETDITIEFTDPQASDSALSVSLDGKAVKVSLGTDGSGNITSTNSSIAGLVNTSDITKDLINAHAAGYPDPGQIADPTGGPVALAGDKGVWKYDGIGADRIVVTHDYDTEWGPAHGRLFVDTLLPNGALYYRIGGVETRNMDLFGDLNYASYHTYGSENDVINISKGLYKVQIAAPDKNQDQLFLNTMQATSKWKDPEHTVPNNDPEPTALIGGTTDDTLAGARTGNNIAIFSKTEAQLVQGEVTIPAGITGDFRLLTCDLRCEENYDIRLDDTYLLENYTSSEAGTIYIDTVALTNGQVLSIALSRIPGDVDLDRDVDIFDLFAVASAFGTVLGDAGYNPACDFDSDGDVDITDLYTCGSNFGVGV